MAQWWSITLTVIGVLGLCFTMRKHIAGPVIGVGAQTLWIGYAITTNQPAFIASALAYAAVNAYGIATWKRAHDHD